MVKRQSRFHSKIIIVMVQIKKQQRRRRKKEIMQRSRRMRRRRILRESILVALSSVKLKAKAHLERSNKELIESQETKLPLKY